MQGKAPSLSVSATILDRFAQKNPLAASLRFIFERLFVLAEINAVFEKNRNQQYTQQILFSTILQIMLAVVTRKVASVHAAMQALGDDLGASITACYNKLNGTEPDVAAALVAHSYKKGRELLTEMGGLRKNVLPGWRVRVLDGNHLAATQRRLDVLWSVSAGPLPGFALVVFDMATMLMSDVILCEDGHAQERSLTEQIVALVVRGDCWIADRNFCTHAILFGILAQQGGFVIRQHANLVGETLGPRKECGRCETGMLFEETLELTHGEDKRAVRRVTIMLDTPTRDGETELHLLTSLPPEVSAATVAMMYLKRWSIESAFADLDRWLNAEIAPLGYPRAALLGFCVGLMAYNAVSTLLGALRATHGEEVVATQVSGYYIAEYGREAVGVIDDLVEAKDWKSWRKMPLPEAAAFLKGTAARIDLRKLLKHPRGPKKPVPPRNRFKGEPHVSTWKMLNGLHEEAPAPKGSKAR